MRAERYCLFADHAVGRISARLGDIRPRQAFASVIIGANEPEITELGARMKKNREHRYYYDNAL